MIHILAKDEIEKMRATSKLAASVLDHIAPHVVAGATTGDLDRICHEYIVDKGAYPAPLRYKGFPKSICTSINEVVCHGIPDDARVLEDGDIINVDVTTILDGYFGDTSEMFVVGGEPSAEAKKLIDVTRQALWLGIAEVAPGKRVGDIGAAISAFANGEHGYGVVRQFCGHGIGRQFHMDPQIPHVGRRGSGARFKRGMAFTIEPMINVGTPHCDILDDDWTAVTRDGLLSAQVEHTMLVTDDGVEVLTMRESAWRPQDIAV